MPKRRFLRVASRAMDHPGILDAAKPEQVMSPSGPATATASSTIPASGRFGFYAKWAYRSGGIICRGRRSRRCSINYDSAPEWPSADTSRWFAFGRFGANNAASATRTWRRSGCSSRGTGCGVPGAGRQRIFELGPTGQVERQSL